jgi:hypothetical protein
METPPVMPAPAPEQPKKSNNTAIIIAAVVVVALCCCCISLGLLWQYGDRIINSF